MRKKHVLLHSKSDCITDHPADSRERSQHIDHNADSSEHYNHTDYLLEPLSLSQRDCVMVLKLRLFQGSVAKLHHHLNEFALRAYGHLFCPPLGRERFSKYLIPVLTVTIEL